MEFALKLLLRERNLGDAVLALEAIGVKGLETLEILEGAEIDVMVEKHGLPLMTGKLLKKELPSLKPELRQKRKEVEEEQTRMKAEPEEVKRKEVEQEQNRGKKAVEEERKRKAAEGERTIRGEAEHAERKRRKVKQKSVFLVIHSGEPQERWSDFHATQDTQIVGAYSSLAQAKRCAMHYVEETFIDDFREWDYAEDEWDDDENEDTNIRRVVRRMLRGVDWEGEGWFKDCEGREYEPNQRVTVQEHILDEPQYGSSDSDEEEVVVTTGEKEEGVN